MRTVLDIWMPAEDVGLLFEVLDPNGDEEISKEEFSEFINLNKFNTCCNSDDYMTSKCRFMEVMAEIYRIVE